MPEQLHFTDSEEANRLVASDPMALLVGFVLDQQVTVQKAFAGPLAIKERLGSLDADTLASADLEPVFRARAGSPRPARLGRPRAGLPRAAGDPPLPRLDGAARARPGRARPRQLRRRRSARLDR